MSKDEHDKSLKYAFNLLNRKDYTEFELVEKLSNKGFSEATIVDVVEYLKKKRFIDDERYVENYIYFRLKSGYGKFKIVHDLKKKGVDESLIYYKLKDINELESARDVFERKMEILKNKDNATSKIFQFLQRRGYSYDTINELLNRRG